MNEEESIVPRSPFKMLKYLSKGSEKVVFLNDKNLETLKGYKAYVQMSRRGEIQITITGLSEQCSRKLFDGLEAMKATEIVSDKE
jgi:hypothetical protein